ncbi:MAG: hypothetical protein V3R46_05895, partial [Thermoplasmata archaeon]
FHFQLSREIPGFRGPEDRIDFGWPETLNLFTAGTATSNVGFFVELTHDLTIGETDIIRASVTLNNLWLHDLAHLRFGKFDPSTYSAFPLARQQIDIVRSEVVPPGVENRITLLPNATFAKFAGLFAQDGTTPISPRQPALYYAPSQTGFELHGRPFGDWFLYQIGVVNGDNERFGDSNNPKDWYVMMRLDQARSDLFSASLSGFTYFGSNNAKLGFNGPDVSWSQYGIAAAVRYRMVDIYGAYVIDRVTDLPPGQSASFDDTASGATVEVDVLATDRLLLSLRYDHFDGGGDLDRRESNSLLAVQAKYYLRTNIALFVRDDFNLRKAEGGASPARNLRNAFLLGVDLIY